ncbi:hypothetical protein G6F31_016130 [Rhizopus arrhizus]|nr:hypothetical protein G6F31_016130 [Rhizopus arrhizus]
MPRGRRAGVGQRHQPVQDGQCERGRLAGAGLRGAHDIAPFHHDGDGLGLDGRGDRVAGFGDGLQQQGVQPEIGERRRGRVSGGCYGLSGFSHQGLADTGTSEKEQNESATCTALHMHRGNPNTCGRNATARKSPQSAFGFADNRHPALQATQAPYHTLKLRVCPPGGLFMAELRTSTCQPAQAPQHHHAYDDHQDRAAGAQEHQDGDDAGHQFVVEDRAQACFPG